MIFKNLYFHFVNVNRKLSSIYMNIYMYIFILLTCYADKTSINQRNSDQSSETSIISYVLTLIISLRKRFRSIKMFRGKGIETGSA